ncbi:bifunctional DNA primase/polymerase [Caulobacter sp. KR2-114]|uniref:bifunctional DNA primase/polymerase n=1 Tax=Caulobacter sp. KR2-114 TaxID=3400912 RepID=UPI003C07C9A7
MSAALGFNDAARQAPPPGRDALSVALECIARGWPVFPCSPQRKTPLTPNGFHDATLDEATVRNWWASRADAMVGVPTGRASGFWVLDIDTDPDKGKVGMESLDQLGWSLEDLTQTTVQRSASGGWHCLFAWHEEAPVRNSDSAIATHIDARGEGGYVIIAGSRRADGKTYDWHNPPGLFPIAEAPGWLTDAALNANSRTRPEQRLTKPSAQPPGSSQRGALLRALDTSTPYGRRGLEAECRALAATPEGGRNGALNRAAFSLGQLVAGGELDEDEARTALLVAAEANGSIGDDGQSAALKTIESGMTSGMLQPRSAPPRIAANGQLPSAGRPDLRVVSPNEASAAIGFDGLDNVVPGPRPWAFGDILMHRAVTAVASPPGTGKTTWGAQVAIAFALHRELGPWRPKETGAVLILNGEEDRDELKRRLLAACYDDGIEPQQLAGRLLFRSTVETGPLKLVSYSAREGVYVRHTAAIDEIKAGIREANAKLFVLDPLIEFHDCPETNEGFAQVAAVLREIAVECDTAVLVFHHTPKGADSDNAAGNLNALRGGGSLAGVARFVLTMFSMSRDDAKAFGIAKRDAHAFVRVDSAKANMTVVDGRAAWFRRVGVGLNNAADGRPADVIGVLRYSPLEPVEDDDPQAQADEALAKLAAELVRFCVAAGHTSADDAIALDPLTDALNPMATGLRKSAARGRIIGDFAPQYPHGEHLIHVVEEAAGRLRRRLVYVSKRAA